jgi:segregation and condensation protein B
MPKSKTQIAKEIQAVLFYLAEPASCKYLAKILEVSENEIRQGADDLSEFLRDGGLCLVRRGDEIALTTAPEISEIVEKVVRDERQRDLGRAGLETLAIVAYKGPVSRREIEYIRGVNCQFALRMLLLRGLVEKKTKEGYERTFFYQLTMDALLHLGIRSAGDLPEYDNMKKQTEIAEESTGENHGE